MVAKKKPSRGQQQQQQQQQQLLAIPAAASKSSHRTSNKSSRQQATTSQQQPTKMIPERTLVKISATFTICLIAILVFNNLQPSQPTQTITLHLCQLQQKRPPPIQNKVLAYNNKTLVNFVGHLKYIKHHTKRRRRISAAASSLSLADETLQRRQPADHYREDYETDDGVPISIDYLPLKLFFVHHTVIDQDNQELYLICMCAAFKLHLRRVAPLDSSSSSSSNLFQDDDDHDHDNNKHRRRIWSSARLPQEASTYIHSRKQEYRPFYLEGLEFNPDRRRFHCQQPWQVPIHNLAHRSVVDPLVAPYDEILLHIDQLDLELNGGPRIEDKIFTKPIQECSAHTSPESLSMDEQEELVFEHELL